MFSVCEAIFQELKAIAQTAGKGAVERKMAGLSDVLRQVFIKNKVVDPQTLLFAQKTMFRAK